MFRYKLFPITCVHVVIMFSMSTNKMKGSIMLDFLNMKISIISIWFLFEL